MKYRDDNLREALAAEYVLGTLQGLARRRFERSLKDDPRLRRAVAHWQDRLAPLGDDVEAVQPPARVWRNIERQLRSASGRQSGLRSIWASLGFWRGATFASGLAAVLLAALLMALIPTPRQPETMVVVMSDDQAKPAITVSWAAHGRGARRMRIRVIGHAEMAPDTAWELWMLPRDEGKPISLGLISTHETQSLMVPERLTTAINAASGLAMSVEPKGGSPTGLPTGPVLYKGPCTLL
jgi:anti-sigma-K factor RskA